LLAAIRKFTEDLTQLHARLAVETVANHPMPPFGSALEFLQSLPPGPLAFETWDEYERHLREERGAWAR
jgi:hypothetical protein